jgi:hypothetical protein
LLAYCDDTREALAAMMPGSAGPDTVADHL